MPSHNISGISLPWLTLIPRRRLTTLPSFVAVISHWLHAVHEIKSTKLVCKDMPVFIALRLRRVATNRLWGWPQYICYHSHSSPPTGHQYKRVELCMYSLIIYIYNILHVHYRRIALHEHLRCTYKVPITACSTYLCHMCAPMVSIALHWLWGQWVHKLNTLWAKPATEVASHTCSLPKVLQFVSSLGHLLNVVHHHPLHLVGGREEVTLQYLPWQWAAAYTQKWAGNWYSAIPNKGIYVCHPWIQLQLHIHTVGWLAELKLRAELLLGGAAHVCV